MIDTENRTETPARKPRRRKIIGGLVVGLSVGVSALIVHSSDPASDATSVSADRAIPANGYISGGKCYLVIGQGGFSQEVPCSEFNVAPEKVRVCAGSVVAAGLLATGIGEAFGVAAAGAAIGCVPW